jgi:glycine cleavage system H protein
MSDIPQNLLYTDQHEWVSVEDSIATVGITDYAQNALGDLTYVELPEVGDEVAAGDEICAIESCKAAASVYAPIGGTIVEVNDDLEDNPGLVNEDCYADGWILKLEMSDPSELDALKTPEQYGQIESEEE